ncbi:MAG TPA: thiamine pyrophosphate-dependent enzyme [Hyphomicrobiaceae bacterium]|nr:thiamine pyrophosphate-dependent enzyme [Hyphomicrobiaceae bacterium]
MTARNLSMLNCAEIVIKTMLANGMDTVYCLPGVQNDDFFDALVRTGGLRPVHTRHEQATAYMALGAALASGNPQAYCVVPGPGFLNTTTPLATAQSLGAPVLAISGQIYEQHIGKGIGFLHEIPDQLGIMRTLTKWAAHIDGPEDAGPKIREAFRQLRSGIPQPVGIECGWNMWRKSAEVPFDDEPAKRETPPIDEDAVEAAAKLLAKAKQPIIVVGGGAQDASAEVKALAEMLQAPVVAYRTGLGVLDHRHYLSHRIATGYKLWKGADVVLGIGTRLQQQLDWGTDDRLKIVHLDIDPSRIGRIKKPDVAIVADAAEGLRSLLQRLGKHAGKRDSREGEMQALKAALAEELAPLAPQKAWIDAIRAEVPEDGILVEELTQISYASRLLYPVYGPRTYLTTGYQGTLGWGLPTALGAKVAMPDRAVISVSGDGGFMFGVQELATAAKHRIPVVALVFTDDAYGNVRRIQQDNYEGRVVASDLTNPDFVKLGESFGLRSVRAKNPASLRKAMSEAIKANEPAVIEIPVGTFPDPWRFFVRSRVRG